jgi:hypothetical protein
MQCISCGAEMRIVRVEQDLGMKTAGYEHRTLGCIGCEKTERRLAFSGEAASWPFESRLTLAALSAPKRRAGERPRVGRIKHDLRTRRSITRNA